MKPPRFGSAVIPVKSDFCIAPTFVQFRKDLLEKVLLIRVDPDLALEFSRCILNQPPHDLGVLRWRPIQDLMLGPFKKGLQEDVSLVEDLLAGCSLELDQLSAVLIFDGLCSEFPEPFELLFRRLFL